MWYAVDRPHWINTPTVLSGLSRCILSRRTPVSRVAESSHRSILLCFGKFSKLHIAYPLGLSLYFAKFFSEIWVIERNAKEMRNLGSAPQFGLGSTIHIPQSVAQIFALGRFAPLDYYASFAWPWWPASVTPFGPATSATSPDPRRTA